MRRFGKIRKRTLADGNNFIRRNDYYEMIAYDRNLKEKGRVLLDAEDIERVAKVGSWCIDSNGYPQNYKKGWLHRFLMGKQEGKEMDHINGNKLDNRKQNLRFVKHGENVANWWRNRRLAQNGTYGRILL